MRPAAAGRWNPIFRLSPSPSAACASVSLKTSTLSASAHSVANAVRRAASLAEAAGAVVVSLRVPDIAQLNTIGRVILLSEVSQNSRNDARRGDFGPDVASSRAATRAACFRQRTTSMHSVCAGCFCGSFNPCGNKWMVYLRPRLQPAHPKSGNLRLTFGGEEDVRIASTRLTRGLNVLGLPALSLPCGFDDEGLPIGLQIIGPGFQEALIESGCSVGGSFELNAPAACSLVVRLHSRKSSPLEQR